MSDKAKFRSDCGSIKLICSICKKVIKQESELIEYEWKAIRGEEHLSPQFCEKCKEELDKVLRNCPEQ